MATSMRIGRFVISTVQDHQSLERDPAQVYKDVPARDWDPYRSFALNADGKYRSQWRGHLVRPAAGGGPMVLIDTGMGPGPHQHTGRRGELLDSLAALGVRPEQIDAVVITHCHGDHIGWNVTWPGGAPAATFPNARYHVAGADWDHYVKPDNRNDAFERSVRPLEKLGRLQLTRGEVRIADGVRTLPANGHTPGHQCVVVESEGQTAVLTGDLFHNVAQITEQTWCPVYDWNTTLSRESRAAVLGRAERESWVIFSGHLPIGSSIGRVVRKAGKPAWQAV